MSVFPDPKQNHLLAILSTADYKKLMPHLEVVDLPVNTNLYKSSCLQSYAYFPTTCIASLISDLSDGTSIEFAIVGNEGMIGTSLFMGKEPTSANRAVILSAGQAYRLNRHQFNQGFSSSDTLQHILLNYMQSLISQIAQTAVCNRHHSLDKQLCRLLLLIADRLPSNKINLTQESIANTLGVRREGITEVAGKLQKSGLIRYRRGCILILDRAELEKRVCECYHLLRHKSDNSALTGAGPVLTHAISS